jgi:hypothetical protein
MSKNPKHQLFDAYVEACNYPGKLDETAVESALQQYLSALGVKRDVVRLRQGWTLDENPPLARTINEILDDFQKRTGYKPNSKKSSLAALAALDALAARDAGAAGAALDARDARAAGAARDARDARAALNALDARDARDALDALDARDARDARDALDARAALNALDDAPLRFAKWCIQGRGWWWYNWEISWIAVTEFGAAQRNDVKVSAWSNPLLGAFLNGCWLLFWTSDTLYWVSKPTVHTEKTNGSRRLHNDSYAALESDVENLYFMHGVLVPAFVVVRPDWITIKHIRDEQNAEVRRVMIERMGWDKFCSEAKLKVIHTDTLTANFPSLPVSETVHADMRAVTSYREGVETVELLESEEFKDFDDHPLKFVRVTDPSTAERYTLRVWPDNKRAYEAVAQTFGMTEPQYKKSVYSHS